MFTIDFFFIEKETWIPVVNGVIFKSTSGLETVSVMQPNVLELGSSILKLKVDQTTLSTRIL